MVDPATMYPPSVVCWIENASSVLLPLANIIPALPNTLELNIRLPRAGGAPKCKFCTSRFPGLPPSVRKHIDPSTPSLAPMVEAAHVPSKFNWNVYEFGVHVHDTGSTEEKNDGSTSS